MTTVARLDAKPWIYSFWQQVAAVIALTALGFNAQGQAIGDGLGGGIPSTGSGGTFPSTTGGGIAIPTSGRQGLVIEPRLTIVETYTNNSTFSRNDRQSEFITEISPGIRIFSNGSRVRGFFDYSLRNIIYARDTSPNTTQHSLNAFATIEAVSNWAFVDLNGNISRQSISAFGTQSTDTSRNNANLTEVSTYSVSPYVRGSLSGLANYEIRYRHSVSSSDSSEVSDVSTSDWLGVLSQEYLTRRIGWSVQASRSNVNYDKARDTEADRIRGVVTFIVVPQLKLFISGGQESNNYLTLEKESYSNHGYGFIWRPTERTKVEAEKERRFFGDGHRVVIDHAAARTVWRFSDTKDIVINPNLGAGTSVLTLFDLYFLQFAAIEPDPVKRAQLVSTFLQANGLNANQATGGGFLPSAATLRRLQQLSFSLLNVRDTYSVFVSKSDSRRLDGIAVVADDFAVADMIRQYSIGGSYSRRLTPISALNVFVSWQTTEGSQASRETDLRTYSLVYTNQLGPNTTAGLGVRRSVFDGGGNSYKELAVFGSVTWRF